MILGRKNIGSKLNNIFVSKLIYMLMIFVKLYLLKLYCRTLVLIESPASEGLL